METIELSVRIDA